MSKIVLALGGNALGDSPKEQEEIVIGTAKSIVDLVEDGHQVVIVHGNGPQVGMINSSMEYAHTNNDTFPAMPFPECGSMSQGYIGYHLQKAIKCELIKRDMKQNVATVLSQMVVDKNDNAFSNLSKPIGGFYNEEQAKEMEEKLGYVMKEDSNRGFRRVVASPKPIEFVEKDTVETLLNQNHIVIACGGGGIPVIKDGDTLKGVDAVIDKDFAACKVAELIGADKFFILTAVDRVCINFGKPDQVTLEKVNIDEIEKYKEEGHFAPGSMLPKVEACIQFVTNNKTSSAIIASLEKASIALKGESGTEIVFG